MVLTSNAATTELPPSAHDTSLRPSTTARQACAATSIFNYPEWEGKWARPTGRYVMITPAVLFRLLPWLHSRPIGTARLLAL